MARHICPQLPAMGKKSMMPKVVVKSMFTKAFFGLHWLPSVRKRGGKFTWPRCVVSNGLRMGRSFKVMSLETVEVKKHHET